MRENILLLIEDSIINSKLVSTLDSIGIDAGLYSSSSVSIIYNLLNLESKVDIDDFYKVFFDLMKEGESIDFSASRTHVKKYAEIVLYDLDQRFGS